MRWFLAIIGLLACASSKPTTKQVVAKMTGLEAKQVGFGAASVTVYYLVAKDGTTCSVKAGFYAATQVQSMVSCYWSTPMRLEYTN